MPHADAIAAARSGGIFVLPSVDEAFGVAYVEAMAGWVPAIGLRGEDGPEEIAAAGGGIVLTDPAGLRGAIERTLADRERLGAEARATVERAFTWEHTGRETLAAYEEALAKR